MKNLKIALIGALIIVFASCEKQRYESKTIELGSWNMDLDENLRVYHEIGDDWKNITSISVVIKNDGENGEVNERRYELVAGDNGEYPNGFINGYNSEFIAIARATGGFFDNNFFDDISINRGYLTLTYLK